MLEEITFNNIDKDNEICRFLESCISKETASEENKLYVCVKNVYDLSGMEAIFMLLEENEDTCTIARWHRDEDTTVGLIKRKDLEDNFVPLDKWLSKDNLLWRKYRYSNDDYINFLYHFGTFPYDSTIALIELQDGTYTLTVIGRISPYAFPQITDSYLDDWKNPEYLKAKIIEKIKFDLDDTVRRRNKNN